ncbi:eliciting plant response like [Trichoderma arundinaceum]|uniref:Eliciting plant response like n=1 Tax=Trichoderma arundinaceum TaxID=490622 RepID=A0A395NEU5_TRIAR|nr:eliciting plant response like [Trichoderma arundinaceum]
MLMSRMFQIAAVVAPVSAEIVTATFNALYDDPSRPLSEVSCWRKDVGFMPHLDWKLQKDAVGFIGIDSLSRLNTANCFSCWMISYNGKTISLLAIDGSNSGVVMSLDALQSLTDGRALELDHIDVNAIEVDTSHCGIQAQKLHAHDF